MGYPNFGKVKTLTLPIPKEYMTVEQYKDAFGIDLKKYIRLDSVNGDIFFDCHDLILLNDIYNAIEYLGVISDFYGSRSIRPLSDFQRSSYDAGNTDGVLYLGYRNHEENSIVGIALTIGKDDPFDIEHLKIGTKNN